MLNLLWLLSLPFAVIMYFIPGSLSAKLMGLTAFVFLGSWGIVLAIKLKKQENELLQAKNENASLKDNVQNQQKTNNQEYIKLKEKFENAKKQLDEASKFQEIVNSQPIAVLIAEPAGKIYYASPGVEIITGWPAKDTLGKDWNAIFKSAGAAASDRIESYLRNESKAEKEHDTIIAKDGREITVNSRFWKYEAGKKIGWVFMATSPAVDYNKLRDEFVTNISHELRTPLTVIKGYAEILYDEAKSKDNQTAELMKVVLDESERLANILDSIINFRHASSGQIGLKQEKIDVLVLLNTVVNDLHRKAENKKIKIISKLPESISPAKGDFNALRFAFSQILDNAVKFTNEGGTITVETGGWRLEDSLWKMEINFIDTGVGISSQDLPHIFEKFYRTDQKVHTLQGTGIGLSLCKEIVETNGGSISVTSTAGMGSIFSVTLPMSD